VRGRWHRAQRHYARHLLTAVIGRVDEQAEASARQRGAFARRGDRWRAYPDIPIRVHVRRMLNRRARMGKLRRRG